MALLVNTTLRPLYSLERDPVALVQGNTWVLQGRSCALYAQGQILCISLNIVFKYHFMWSRSTTWLRNTIVYSAHSFADSSSRGRVTLLEPSIQHASRTFVLSFRGRVSVPKPFSMVSFLLPRSCVAFVLAHWCFRSFVLTGRRLQLCY
jgi:hypothetical protein